MKKIKKMSIVLLVFFHLIIFYQIIYGIKSIKEFELNFDYEISFFLVDNHLYVWDSKKFQILIFKDDKPIKNIKFKKGQGPGDLRIVNDIFSTPKYFVLWDRLQRQFSYFTKEWKFVKIEKFPLLSFASPLGIWKDQYLFQWSSIIRDKKGSEIVQKVGIIKMNGDKDVLVKMGGVFNYLGRLNNDRPFLVVSFSKNTLFYANINEYKIYSIDLNNNSFESSLFIKKKLFPVKWNNKLGELKWKVVKKDPLAPQDIYPKYLPPIYCIISNYNSDIIGIVSNENILKKETTIDLYNNGNFMDQIRIPIVYQQHFIFPPLFYFKEGIILAKNSLYTCHYQEDVFKIIKWKIKF